jgi:hypothetical protein
MNSFQYREFTALLPTSLAQKACSFTFLPVLLRILRIFPRHGGAKSTRAMKAFADSALC